jgi:TolB-like protein/Flp pilus assembly protein TadD/predicted Ser/Thr protein kinase
MTQAADGEDEGRPSPGFSGGTVISHYRIIERLGAGGMGEVYLAEDTKLKRSVALKFLPDWLSSNKQARERLTREAQAASKLSHPNIVSIHAIEEVDALVFIVMEYVEGESLRELLQGVKLTIEKVLDLGIQIAEGLAAAHQAGVIHRDLKPSNILIDPDGRPKMADFGLARVKRDEKLTTAGLALGTLSYMSPEQVQGEVVDNRSDIFSLGVVLYEMITGHLPFKGEYEASILYSIVNETPEPLSEHRPAVPDSLQKIVFKCLEKDPSLRYQSTSEVIYDLRRIVEGGATGDQAGKRRGTRPRLAVILFAALFLAAAAIIIFGLIPRTLRYDIPQRKMLAVLPFDNLGQSADAYFADGITDAITTRLAKVEGLGVISRASAMQYDRSEKSLREFGTRLGADYILDGTVYWDKSTDVSKVKINTNLIRVKDDTYVWAESYRRDLDKIFDVQAEIAQEVTQALNVVLLEPERLSLREKPTDSLDAYIYYLRGNEYFNRSWGERDLAIAIEMYQNAVKSDPTFAVAYASLSRGHSAMYRELHDRTDQRMGAAKQAVEMALNLEPDLPEAHYALGMYYYNYAKFDSALVEFAIAQKSQPSNSDLFSAIAGVQRHQGKIDQAVANYEKAFRLDPLSPLKAFDLGLTYGLMREYSAAKSYMDRAISIAPDWPLPYIYKAWLYLCWEGNKKRAAEIIQEASEKVDLVQSEYREYYWWLSRILDDDYSKTLERITLGTDTTSYYLYRARVFGLMGKPHLKEAYSDSARVILEPRVKSHPGEARFHSQLGLAYAGLGRKELAISEGRRAVELLPAAGEALDAQFWVANLAEIYVITGEFDAAVEQLNVLLAIPGFASPQYLRIDPLWKPLRNHPGFVKLLER